MPDFLKNAEELADKARDLHRREKRITLESVDIIGEMDRRNVGGYLLLNTGALAKRVELSEDQFLKRRQAARVLWEYPQFRSLVEAGEISISSLAVIAARVTPAN